jgi:hypothetical protein
MRISVNALGEFACGMTFDNGWAIIISQQSCGHLSLAVVPHRIFEDASQGAIEFINNPDHWSKEAVVKRGDYIDHFDGDDTALLDFITQVRLRFPEPSFAKIGQDIMKAVKS